MTLRPAVFLDRDGTLTEPRHYPSRPEDLVLQPGVGPELGRLQRQGRALVVITNQSGLARGLFSLQDLDDMHGHLREALAGHGVVLDGIYACPHHRDGAVDGLSFRCDCRKPGTGLLRWAADELGIGLTDSWMVGDAASDVAAGRAAGCRTAWVGPAAVRAASADPTTATLCTATTAAALRRVADDRMRVTQLSTGPANTDRTTP